MCGRFGLVRPDRVNASRFGVTAFPPVAPRVNISPGAEVPIVRLAHAGRVVSRATWGLVPHWAKDASLGRRLVNARADTALLRPAFRDAFLSRRCLVPADVFFEWKKTGTASKQPYAVGMADGSTFALGGLWDVWRGGEKPLLSFTILTTEPNVLLAAIHDRMPVIVDPRAYSAWLDVRTPEARLATLVRPIEAAVMRAWPISTRINRSEAEGVELLDPMSLGD